MTLEKFLETVGASESDLNELQGDEVMAAVQQNGDALRYVPDANRTAEVCLAAVQQNGDALQYVKKCAFEAVKIVLIGDVKYTLTKAP